MPFKANHRMIKEMVDELKRIAKETKTLEYIEGKGVNEAEKKRDKESKYLDVKYYYLRCKAGSQKMSKDKAFSKAQNSLKTIKC